MTTARAGENKSVPFFFNQIIQNASGTGNNPVIDLSTVTGNGWSVERARLLSEKLPSIDPDGVSRNNQEQALRDFLALYALTQQDSIADNGTWEELDVKNAGARAALFGDGNQTGGLISRVLIGGEGAGQNPFDNIRSVLAALNITANNKAENHLVGLPPPRRWG